MKIDLGFMSTMILTGILKAQIAKSTIEAGQSVNLLTQGIRDQGKDYEIAITVKLK